MEKFEDYQVIDFNTTWGCHILLKVCDIQEIKLNYNAPNDYDVFVDSTIEIKNDNFIFEFNAMFSDEQGNEAINKIALALDSNVEQADKLKMVMESNNDSNSTNK